MIHIHLACRLLIAGVFLVAVVSKVRNRHSYAAFARSVEQIGLVPSRLVGHAAAAVALGEGATAALLLWPGPGRVPLGLAGFGLAVALLTAFVVAIRRTRQRNVAVDCRCFGPSTEPLGLAHLWRNAALLVIVAVGVATVATTGDYRAGPVAVSASAALVGVLLAVFFVDLVSPFTDAVADRPGAVPATGRRALKSTTDHPVER